MYILHFYLITELDYLLFVLTHRTYDLIFNLFDDGQDIHDKKLLSMTF